MEHLHIENVWDPPGCYGITLKKTPDVIPFLWAISSLWVSGFSSFILLENGLQVSCSPFKAKFLKASSQFHSIKYFRMESAWGSVCKRASVCGNQMQLDVLILEMWWGNSCSTSIRKKGWWAVIILQMACYHWGNCFAWEWQTSCRSSNGCEELQEGTSLWVLQETCFICFTPSCHCNMLTAGFEIPK